LLRLYYITSAKQRNPFTLSNFCAHLYSLIFIYLKLLFGEHMHKMSCMMPYQHKPPSLLLLK